MRGELLEIEEDWVRQQSMDEAVARVVFHIVHPLCEACGELVCANRLGPCSCERRPPEVHELNCVGGRDD